MINFTVPAQRPRSSYPPTITANSPTTIGPKPYGFTESDTIPAFLRRKNISCARASIGSQKTQEEWEGNCNSISRIAYSRMIPALRRVGEMMEASEPFFARILFAKRKVTPDMVPSDDPQRPKKYLDSDFLGACPEEWEAYDQVMSALPSRLRVYMGRDEVCTRLPCYAYSSFEYDPSPGSLSIHINPAYLAFFSERDYDGFSDTTRNTVLFMLATTIMHEMAHVIWHVRKLFKYYAYCENSPEQNDRPKFNKDSTEPIYDVSFPDNELGRAWEHYMFGGITEFIDKVNVLGPKGCLLWIDQIEFSNQHSFFAQHGGFVPGVWYIMHESIINACFDEELMEMAWQRWHRVKSEAVAAENDFETLKAMAATNDVKILEAIRWAKKQKEVNQLGLEKWEVHASNLAEYLPNMSSETQTDLEALKWRS